MKRSTLTYGAAIVLCTAAGVWYGWQRQVLSNPDRGAVTALFAQTLPNLHGQPQALAQWRGKLLLVNFWATWCGPCVQEMPELSALQRQLGERVQIIGIGIDKQSAMEEFVARLPVDYPLYVGGMAATDLTRQFGDLAGGLPFTVLIDAQGRVVQRYRGRLKIADVQTAIAGVTPI